MEKPRPQSTPLPERCRPPEGFLDTPHPDLSAPGPMVARSDTIVIDRPPRIAVPALQAAPLEAVLPKTRALPGVVGAHDLTPQPFGPPGSRRLLCLSDDSHAVEQVLARDDRQFRYVVWNYTTRAARPVAFAIGHFRYDDAGAGRTRVVWTYSFRLREDRFPGLLGGFGRWLLKVAFLDTAYAELMRETLAGMKRHVESTTAAAG